VARFSTDEYARMGQSALLDLLRQEHAVLWSEAQAKISDTRWTSLPTRIDPHHLSTARLQLLRSKRITIVVASTRGGHQVPVMHLADTRGVATRVATAAARKRALMATLNSWVSPRPGYRLGLIGEAGERVARESLRAAAPHGWRVERPDGGEVHTLLGHPVEGGPLDSAGWVTVVNLVGQPVDSVLCPIEVKNIRHWIYPNAPELFQLLYKAAHLQARHEDVKVCPVLITRRKSYSANAMSRELGFRILDVGKQFVLPVAHVDPAALERIQNELGFADLTPQDTADPGLTRALEQVPKTALQNAANWRSFGPGLLEQFAELRSDLSQAKRHAATEELREAVRELGGEARW
jgi:hypothetical protein